MKKPKRNVVNSQTGQVAYNFSSKQEAMSLAKELNRKPSRNVLPLLSSLGEGAGFALGERAVSARRKSKKTRRNPAPKYAVRIGTARKSLIYAGPKRTVRKLARQFRSVLGTGRVRLGRLVPKKPKKRSVR